LRGEGEDGRKQGWELWAAWRRVTQPGARRRAAGQERAGTGRNGQERAGTGSSLSVRRLRSTMARACEPAHREHAFCVANPGIATGGRPWRVRDVRIILSPIGVMSFAGAHVVSPATLPHARGRERPADGVAFSCMRAVQSLAPRHVRLFPVSRGVCCRGVPPRNAFKCGCAARMAPARRRQL
jgi:hypothetical protein